MSNISIVVSKFSIFHFKYSLENGEVIKKFNIMKYNCRLQQKS